MALGRRRAPQWLKGKLQGERDSTPPPVGRAVCSVFVRGQLSPREGPPRCRPQESPGQRGEDKSRNRFGGALCARGGCVVLCGLQGSECRGSGTSLHAGHGSHSRWVTKGTDTGALAPVRAGGRGGGGAGALRTPPLHGEARAFWMPSHAAVQRALAILSCLISERWAPEPREQQTIAAVSAPAAWGCQGPAIWPHLHSGTLSVAQGMTPSRRTSMPSG